MTVLKHLLRIYGAVHADRPENVRIVEGVDVFTGRDTQLILEMAAAHMKCRLNVSFVMGVDVVIDVRVPDTEPGRAGDRMVILEMTDKGLIKTTIDRYTVSDE